MRQPIFTLLLATALVSGLAHCGTGAMDPDDPNDPDDPSDPNDPAPVFSPLVIPNGDFEGGGPSPVSWTVQQFWGSFTAQSVSTDDGSHARLTVGSNSYGRFRPDEALVPSVAVGELYRLRARVRLPGVPEDEWDEVSEEAPWTPPVQPKSFNIILVGVDRKDGEIANIWELAWSPATELTQRWTTLETSYLVPPATAGMELWLRIVVTQGPDADTAEVYVDGVTLERATGRTVPEQPLILNAAFEHPQVPDGEFTYGWYGWKFDFISSYVGIVRHGSDIMTAPPEGPQALEIELPIAAVSEPVAFVAGRYYQVSVRYARRKDMTIPSGNARVGVFSVGENEVLRDVTAPAAVSDWQEVMLNCFSPTAAEVAGGLKVLIGGTGGGRLLLDDVRVTEQEASLCSA